MSTTIIENLLASGNAVTGNVIRQVGGKDSSGNVLAYNATANSNMPMEMISSSIATFCAITQATALGNGKSMLSLVNATASTKIVRVREIYCQNVQTATITGVVFDFALFRITGHSAGTSVTPRSYDTNDSLDSSITARTNGTITGEVSTPYKRWFWGGDELSLGRADAQTTALPHQNMYPCWKENPLMKPIVLRATEGIHIKCETNTTVGTWDIVFIFTQE